MQAVLADHGPGPVSMIARRQKLDAVVGGMEALPERQRRALVMHELEDRSHSQIGRALGVSAGASKALVCRARQGVAAAIAAAAPRSERRPSGRRRSPARRLPSWAMSTARAAEPHAAQRAAAAPPVLAAGRRALPGRRRRLRGAGLRSPLPVLFPDEFRYSHLARGIADGTGSDWRGHTDRPDRGVVRVLHRPRVGLLVHGRRLARVEGDGDDRALHAGLPGVVAGARRAARRPPPGAASPRSCRCSARGCSRAPRPSPRSSPSRSTTAALCCAVMALRRPGSRWAGSRSCCSGWRRGRACRPRVLAPALLDAFLHRRRARRRRPAAPTARPRPRAVPDRLRRGVPAGGAGRAWPRPTRSATTARSSPSARRSAT